MSNANELLRWTLLELDEFETPSLVEEIRTFLAAEPEAEEPVGYVYTDNGTNLKHGAINDHTLANGTPLYTRPSPARKPMTEEEIQAAYKKCVPVNSYCHFYDGIRAAEKHHGLTLQDQCRGDKL